MNKLILLTAACALSGLAARADLFNYDFGSGTGSHTSGISTIFLPTTPAGGGSTRVRIGTGTGSFDLVNPGDAIGSDTELQGTAPTNTSVNKFSIYDLASPSAQFSVAFDLKLTGASAGNWYLFTGDGASLSDNSGFTGAQIMSGIRWTFAASGGVTESYRNGGGWSALSDVFSQDNAYRVEIFSNNGAASASYGASQSLAPNTWDLWVNSTLVGDDLAKAQLPGGANIDSFMFYGEGSAGNTPKIILDNIQYSNALTVVPEPASAGLLALGLLLLRRRR